MRIYTNSLLFLSVGYFFSWVALGFVGLLGRMPPCGRHRATARVRFAPVLRTASRRSDPLRVLPTVGAPNPHRQPFAPPLSAYPSNKRTFANPW